MHNFVFDVAFAHFDVYFLIQLCINECINSYVYDLGIHFVI